MTNTPGRIVRKGRHECPTPPWSVHTTGTIWQCDCGRYWYRDPARWVTISILDVALLQMNDSLLKPRSQKS